MPRSRSFALHASGDGFVAVDDRGVRLQLVEADFLTRRERLAQRLKRATAFVLRWVGRVLYAGPLLWVGSLLAPAPIDGYLLVGFVCAVVAFFAVLNLFVIVSVVVWKTGLTPRIELDPPHRHAASTSPRALPVPETHEAPLEPGTLLTVTGRVVSLAKPADHAVAIDLWSTGEVPLRLTEVRPFAVLAEGRMAVVVSSAYPPQVHATAEPSRFGDAMMTLSPQTRAFFDRLPIGNVDDEATVDRVTLRPGDEVRVTGVVHEVAEDVTRILVDGQELSLEGDRDGAPYREGERQRGVIVGATPTTALVIERR